MSIKCDRYHHDLMVETMVHKYGVPHGHGYVVGHPLHPETGEQDGKPFFMMWNEKIMGFPQPSENEIEMYYHANKTQIHANAVRRFRGRMLEFTDPKGTAPDDAPADVKAKAHEWKTYRQALRDITKQQGFPHNVEWPDSPK